MTQVGQSSRFRAFSICPKKTTSHLAGIPHWPMPTESGAWGESTMKELAGVREKGLTLMSGSI